MAAVAGYIGGRNQRLRGFTKAVFSGSTTRASTEGVDPAVPSRLVVYDIDLPPFMENRALDADLMRQYPGASAGPALAERLRAHDVEMQTADVFLRSPKFDGKAVVYSNDTTRFTRRLIHELGIPGAVCSSAESPIVVWRFYSDLSEISAWYRNMCLFPGARERVSPSSHFEPMYWPYPDLTPADSPPWSGRGFLTLVNSNKRAFGWPAPLFDVRHPRSSAIHLYRAWGANRAHRSDDWFRTELYLDRLDSIRHFGAGDGFDLYGRGWDGPTSGADAGTRAAIHRSYRGEIPPHDKLKVLEGYKFSLCFENCAFPGYITEKIFDCLIAGTIPIYLGAPDVAEYIPAEAFIDFREFAGYPELETFIRGISDADGQAYVEAARAFLGSPAAQRFTEEHFVTEMSRMLLESLEDQ